MDSQSSWSNFFLLLAIVLCVNGLATAADSQPPGVTELKPAPPDDTALPAPAPSPAPATQPDDAEAARPAPTGLLKRLRGRLDALPLSDDQKARIDSMFSKAGDDLKAAAETLKSATRQEHMQRYREILSNLRNEVESVLTDDQKQKIRAAQAGGPGQLMKRLGEGLKKLELSDTQKQQVESALKEAKTRFEAIRSTAGEAGAEVRDKLRAAADDLRQKLGDILTDEQKEKLRDFMQSEAPGATTRPGQ